MLALAVRHVLMVGGGTPSSRPTSDEAKSRVGEKENSNLQNKCFNTDGMRAYP